MQYAIAVTRRRHIVLPCALSSMAGRQSRHPPCNAVQTIAHPLTPHLALQSHPPQPATNKNATSADAVAQWLQRVRREPNFQTMNAGAIAIGKRGAGSVTKGKRGDDEFMNGLPAALLRLFQTTRKQLDVSKLGAMGWSAAIPLAEGLVKTYGAFKETLSSAPLLSATEVA